MPRTPRTRQPSALPAALQHINLNAAAIDVGPLRTMSPSPPGAIPQAAKRETEQAEAAG